jgi:hypothetical protein
MLIPSAISIDVTDQKAWSMFGGDPRHTGISDFDISGVKGGIENRLSLSPVGTAIEDEDGNIYVASTNSRLYALSPELQILWYFKTNAPITGTPALGPDGSLYVATYTDVWSIEVPTLLYSIDTAGSVNWVHPISGNGSPMGVCASDEGKVYLGTDAGDLICFDENGTQDWRYHTEGGIYSCPAVDGDGTVYFSSRDRYLHAVSPQGEMKWRIQVGVDETASPSIGDDGTIYYGSSNSYLYAIEPNGTIVWRFLLDNGVRRGIALSPDGTIVTQSGRFLMKISDGELVWSQEISGGNRDRAPAVDRDGNIVIVYSGYDEDEVPRCFVGGFSTSGEMLWSVGVGDNCHELYSPSITSKGKVLVAQEGQDLYVIGQHVDDYTVVQLIVEIFIIGASLIIVFQLARRNRRTLNGR